MSAGRPDAACLRMKQALSNLNASLITGENADICMDVMRAARDAFHDSNPIHLSVQNATCHKDQALPMLHWVRGVVKSGLLTAVQQTLGTVGTAMGTADAKPGNAKSNPAPATLPLRMRRATGFCAEVLGAAGQGVMHLTSCRDQGFFSPSPSSSSSTTSTSPVFNASATALSSLFHQLSDPQLMTSAAGAVRGLTRLMQAPGPVGDSHRTLLSALLCSLGAVLWHCFDWAAAQLRVAGRFRVAAFGGVIRSGQHETGPADEGPVIAFLQALRSSGLLQAMCLATCAMPSPDTAAAAFAADGDGDGDAAAEAVREAETHLCSGADTLLGLIADCCGMPKHLISAHAVPLLAAPEVQLLLVMGIAKLAADGGAAADLESVVAEVHNLAPACGVELARRSGTGGAGGGGKAGKGSSGGGGGGVSLDGSWLLQARRPAAMAQEAAVSLHRAILRAAPSVWVKAAEVGRYRGPPMPPPAALPRLLAAALHGTYRLMHGDGVGGMYGVGVGSAGAHASAPLGHLLTAIGMVLTHTFQDLIPDPHLVWACMPDGLAAAAWGMALALEVAGAADAGEDDDDDADGGGGGGAAARASRAAAERSGTVRAAPAEYGLGQQAAVQAVELFYVLAVHLQIGLRPDQRRPVREDKLPRLHDTLLSSALLRTLDATMRLLRRGAPHAEGAANTVQYGVMWLSVLDPNPGVLPAALAAAAAGGSGGGGVPPRRWNVGRDLGVFVTCAKVARARGAALRRVLREAGGGGGGAAAKAAAVVTSPETGHLMNDLRSALRGIACLLTQVAPACLLPPAAAAASAGGGGGGRPGHVDPRWLVARRTGTGGGGGSGAVTKAPVVTSEAAAALAERPDVRAVVLLCAQAGISAAAPLLTAYGLRIFAARASGSGGARGGGGGGGGRNGRTSARGGTGRQPGNTNANTKDDDAGAGSASHDVAVGLMNMRVLAETMCRMLRWMPAAAVAPAAPLELLAAVGTFLAGVRSAPRGAVEDWDDVDDANDAVAAALSYAAAHEALAEPVRQALRAAAAAAGDASAAAPPPPLPPGTGQDVPDLASLMTELPRRQAALRPPLRRLTAAACAGGAAASVEAFRAEAEQVGLALDEAWAERKGVGAVLRSERAKLAPPRGRAGSGGGGGGDDDDDDVHDGASAAAWPVRICSNPACEVFEGAHECRVARKKCARCRVARYCCAECQRQHWQAGHKAECRAPE